MRQLKRSDLTAEGIKIVQSKDGKYSLREWTESLRKVARRALQRSKRNYVFTQFTRPALDRRRDTVRHATHEANHRHRMAIPRSEGQGAFRSRDQSRPDATVFQDQKTEGRSVRLENRLELIRIFGGDGWS